jgi:methionyl-tRNA formyltransferase
VHAFAQAQGLAVRTPKSLKGADEQAAFAALDLDAAVVVAYGLILPQAILDAPRLGCLNVHASLLPRWRGAAPIQRAIMAGDTETGITIMQMEAGLDTGPMLMKERVPIGPHTTAGALHDSLKDLGGNLLVRALAALDRGQIEPVPQDDRDATYAPKIDKAEAKIDWGRNAEDVARQVLGLSPFPGAYFEAADEKGRTARIKVLLAEAVAGAADPGTLLGDGLTVACGTGALRLVTVQRAGKGAMPAGEFARGFAMTPGRSLQA